MKRTGRKRHLFMWYRPDNDTPAQWNLPGWLISSVIILVIAISVSIVLGAIFYSSLLRRALGYNQLAEENDKLRTELARVEIIQSELDELQEFAGQIQRSLTEGSDLNRILSARKAVYNELPQGANMGPWVPLAPVENNIDSLNNDEVLSNIKISSWTSLPERWPVEGYITRGFELYPIDPGRSHTGIDFAVPRGTPVRSTASGWVVVADWTPRYGNCVVLDHGGGIYSIYGHNELNLVLKYQFVKTGDPIALSGTSGISTAPHLHFEVLAGGRAVDPHHFLPPPGEENGD